MPAHELRALLRACDADIAQTRAVREAARAQRLADCGTPGTLGWLLQDVDQHCRGIFPSKRELSRSGQNSIRTTLKQLGGLKQVEPCLYPRAESLLPYYLAMMIHTAGNPDLIAELERDCLQSLPLLDDRQVLVWFKACDARPFNGGPAAAGARPLARGRHSAASGTLAGVLCPAALHSGRGLWHL